MNKQLQFGAMTSIALTATLVATLTLMPIAEQKAFAGVEYTGRICHYEEGTGLWGIETPSLNGWLNGHKDKHTDGFLYDFQIAANGSEDELCLALNGEQDPFDGFKTWTYTNYNWDPICDVIPFGGDGVEEIFDGECLTDYRPRNINNEFDYVLADSLDPPIEDGISDVVVQVKKNDEISNMNPGAVYALTTVYVQADLDMLQVDENYGDCTDVELELLNQNKLSRNVKVAVAAPNGDVTEVTDILYDELDDGVIFVEDVDSDSAKVKINDSSLLTDESTIYVLVKFNDQLRGEDSGILPLECMNTEDVTSTIGEEDPFQLTFEASLRISQAQ